MLIVFSAGALCGGILAAWWYWERFIHDSNTMKIEYKVDASAINQLNEVLVMAWLDARGLMWMPKGMEKIIARRSR